MTESNVPGSNVASNADQIAYWNDRAAQSWVAMQEKLDAGFAAITAAALDAAAVQAGERVLDVGCGCGATTIELARRVGPSGHVTGLDVSAPMAARARERLAEAGLGQAEVTLSDAATHPFAAADIDLLFSRFGVMFFADPTAAFANLRTAMAPLGRLTFAAWRPMRESSWFRVPVEAAREVVALEPPADPRAPGPFAFAEAAHVEAVLGGAGWRDVTVTPHDLPMRLAGAGELDAAADSLTGVGPVARALGEHDEATRARVRAAVAAALRPYDGAGGVVLTAAIWVVSARR